MVSCPVRRAWLLNLDADDELARPSARTSSRAMTARIEALAARLTGLVPPGDVVVASGARADGLTGRAFSPTPRALAALTAAGAIPPEAPSLEILRRVNHRRFCAELGQTLDGARFADTRAELTATIGTEGQWLLKRPFGFAGRGRLRIDASAVTPPEDRWIDASLAAGDGLQVEPWVTRAGDFGLHGFLAATGALTLGEPTEQGCDERGAWVSTDRAPASSLEPWERDALEAATTAAAAALSAVGYFGPFGVDAFRYLDASGLRRWNPRCEINARYSMGWAVGMGDRRPDL